LQLSNKVVIKFLDGTVIKGITNDFIPTKDTFHVIHRDDDKDMIKEVRVNVMKAVFFVKDFYGKRGDEKHTSAPVKLPGNVGKRVSVTFSDGEVISGYTYSFKDDELGFFLFPLNEADNNHRIFIVTRNVSKISRDVDNKIVL